MRCVAVLFALRDPGLCTASWNACVHGVCTCVALDGVGGGVFLQMLHEQSAAAEKKLGEAWKRNTG